jgi:hypothetical protein
MVGSGNQVRGKERRGDRGKRDHHHDIHST